MGAVSASLLLDAAVSATAGDGGTTAVELERHSLAEVERRWTAVLGAVAWMAPTSADAFELLRQAPDYPGLLAHPSARYLLAAIRRATRTAPDRLPALLSEGLADLVWPRQLRDGLGDGSWKCRADIDGGLRASGLGIFVELGPAYSDMDALVRVAGDRAEIVMTTDGLTVEVVPDDLAPSGPKEIPSREIHGFDLHTAARSCDGIEVDARDPWLRPRLTGTNQRSDGTAFHGSTWEHYRHDPHVGSIDAAIDLIRSVWPEVVDELRRFVHVIVPLRAGRSEHRAFTVGSRQGAIFVGDAAPAPLAEMLLHELAHVKLRQMQLLDPLLDDPLDESRRVAVPWRPDPRPVPGVLEGLFVFSHVAELQLRLLEAGHADALVPRAEHRVAHLRHAEQLLATNADLTPTGRRFVDVLGAWVATLTGRIGP